jgi:hypothetical protein
MIKQFLLRFSEHLAKLITEKDFNLPHQLKKEATKDSVKFYNEHMNNSQIFLEKELMINFELKNITKEGLYLEFGVAKAHTTNYLANKIKPIVIHGFDSFRGFPEYFDGTGEEYHDYDGKPPKVKKNVILHNGFFKDTLPVFSKNNDQEIAYLNIDCDLYSSTKTVFDYLGNKIQKGTIIHFDEYLNFPDWRNHEYKVWKEFVEENNVEFEYLAIGGKGMVALKVLDIQHKKNISDMNKE